MPTILELFQNSELDNSVKSDKETLVEQETSGIRVKSAVELNNPLIYGNESIRIAQRTTSAVETMIGSKTEGGGGGLNKAISSAKKFVNDKLGIPSSQIPSSLIDKIKETNTDIPINTDLIGDNGTVVGNFLKDIGGGNPSTLGKQAVGNAIGKAKDSIRGAIFGEQPKTTANTAEPEEFIQYTTSDRTYSEVNKSKLQITSKEELETTKLDLSLVSPIYGLKRADGKFGSSPSSMVIRNARGEVSKELEQNNIGNKQKEIGTLSWDDASKTIGSSLLPDDNGKYKANKGGESVEVSKEDLEKYDIIPFWISGLQGTNATFFKCVITGLNETSTPTWSGNKFVGNPYSYYTYGGVERSVTFTLNLYCTNQTELLNNWTKLTFLTKKVYPHIQDNVVNPPFIQFRLGDIYNGKTGFIESLTYTFPDTGNWETTLEGGKLPKLIDVSITIKLVELPGSELSLYSFEKSEEAIKSIKESYKKIGSEDGGDSVSGGTQTGEGAEPKVTVNDKTGETTSEPAKESTGGTKNLQGKAEKTPEQLKQEAIMAYKSKIEETTAKRLVDLKKTSVTGYLLKSLSENHKVLIDSIEKIEENIWKAQQEYTSYGTVRTQTMYYYNTGPNGSAGSSYLASAQKYASEYTNP